MSKFSPRAGYAALLLVTAACSQPPAMVEMKGQNTYGRNSYASNSAPLYSYAKPSVAAPMPAYTTVAGNTASSAGIQPVGVHELSALSPAAGGAPPPSSLASSTPPPSAINPWTGKPHFTEAENAPAPQTKPVAQLDSIIGNDGGKPTKTHATNTTHVAAAHPAVTHVAAAKTKPIKMEAAAFMWPVNGKHIISAFGPKGNGKTNDGINIAASEGEPVWASADGEVVYVGNELQGYGNMVLIKHSGNKTTAYAHLNRPTVDKYDRVKQGDIIGYVGTTGNVKEPQLHFAIRDGKDPVDPAKYLSRSVASAN